MTFKDCNSVTRANGNEVKRCGIFAFQHAKFSVKY